MTRLISVEGNIGSGKSTFVKELEQYYSIPINCNGKKICFLQEPVDTWSSITDKDGKSVIECFYADNKAYAFAFQMMAYISRLAIIKKALKKNYDIIFMERCLFTDRNVFAKMLYDDGKINEIEYKIYNTWFDEFIADFPKIEYIYIKTDPKVASKRIIKRGRLGENIPLTYLTECHNYHDKWLQMIESPLIIDGNINFTENPDIIAQWINTVSTWVKSIEDKIDYCMSHLSKSIANEYILTFDGACRGNPGPCGAGFVIWRNKEVFYQGKEYVADLNTNNYAEYSALILGLQKCIDCTIDSVHVQGDSLLVIKQINKDYNIESQNLRPLYDKVNQLLNHINILSCVHISRKQNGEADRLANQILDEYIINGVGVWERA